MKSLILFGSSVFRPMNARDIDILVVVDKIDLHEKISLEINIIKALKNTIKKNLDVIVLDENSLLENIEPGAVASGLIAGYKVIYDEINIENLIIGIAKRIAFEKYIIQKSGKKINLSAIAKARIKLNP